MSRKKIANQNSPMLWGKESQNKAVVMAEKIHERIATKKRVKKVIEKQVGNRIFYHTIYVYE
jgi:hypothetical protein